MNLRIVIIGLVLVTLSCQPPKTSQSAKGVVPHDLAAVMQDGGFELAWQCQVDRTISGYNIYASELPLGEQYPDGRYPAEVKPINHPVFPGDTDLSDGVEHYTAKGLKNGREYYVTVRTVFPDQTESKPSKAIKVIPGPSGEIDLVARFSGENDGWSFEKSRYVTADDVLNDLFYHSQNGVNYLSSPTRLDGFLNQTELEHLPYKGDFKEVRRKVNQGVKEPLKDQVEVRAGDWVLAKLASDKHVLIEVVGFQKAANQVVTLKYYTCTLAGEIHF